MIILNESDLVTFQVYTSISLEPITVEHLFFIHSRIEMLISQIRILLFYVEEIANNKNKGDFFHIMLLEMVIMFDLDKRLGKSNG